MLCGGRRGCRCCGDLRDRGCPEVSGSGAARREMRKQRPTLPPSPSYLRSAACKGDRGSARGSGLERCQAGTAQGCRGFKHRGAMTHWGGSLQPSHLTAHTAQMGALSREGNACTLRDSVGISTPPWSRGPERHGAGSRTPSTATMGGEWGAVTGKGWTQQAARSEGAEPGSRGKAGTQVWFSLTATGGGMSRAGTRAGQGQTPCRLRESQPLHDRLAWQQDSH